MYAVTSIDSADTNAATSIDSADTNAATSIDSAVMNAATSIDSAGINVITSIDSADINAITSIDSADINANTNIDSLMDSVKCPKRILDPIVLWLATDIAWFGFIVQNSISYLDLQLHTESRISKYLGSFCDNCRPKHCTNFLNTDEKCRQFFAPKRRLLYNLNLDLPKGREHSLKDAAPNSFYAKGCCSSPHIAEIIIGKEFYADIFTDFIFFALDINMPKEKILKLLTKVPFSEMNLLFIIDVSCTSEFIDCFYPEVTDFELFRGFIQQFDILEYILEYEQPEKVEFLLYHVRLQGTTIRSEFDNDLISSCVFLNCYLNIGPVLKYISESRPTDTDCEDYLQDLTSDRPVQTQNIKDRAAEKFITRSRLGLLMQVIRAYIDSSQQGTQEAAAEALRLIWSSVPEAFATHEEFSDVFGTVLMQEVLRNVFDFYVQAVGESCEQAEPRSLKHLCRTFLRRTFEKNNLWIPDGVSRTSLPKSLLAFLNLETTFAI